MKYILVGNPVMSKAEALSPIAEYDSLEEAQKAVDEARLETTETVEGVWYSFKKGTPFRNFNGIFSRNGKLKFYCRGEGFGGWNVHGGDCPCGKEPDKYSSFDSPVVFARKD